MDALNRYEREILRRIQSDLHRGLDTGSVSEQLGTVDVYFHPQAHDMFLNCVTPHKGVAWVHRDDLLDGLVGLIRLGRTPRLIFQEALFPAAFQQQLRLMGLRFEAEQSVMLYRPLLGPVPVGETLFGCLPDQLPLDIETLIVTTWEQIETWLHVFYAAYYNTQAPPLEPQVIEALRDEIAAGHVMCVLAYYQGTPLGVAQIALREDSAEFETVTTQPLWHGMGLETGLIMTAVREVELRSAVMMFTVEAPGDTARIYRRLGFDELSRVLVYQWPEDLEAPA